MLNGYRQFDPVRGASYQLDLEVTYDQASNTPAATYHRRVNVFRPLGLTEILPMPYVTETSRITMVVGAEPNIDLTKFLERYEKYILSHVESAEKIYLFIVMLTKQGEDKYSSKNLETMINGLEKKYKVLSSGKSKIVLGKVELVNKSRFYEENYRQVALSEYVSRQLSNEALGN